MEKPCIGSTWTNLTDYPRLLLLIEIFLNPDAGEPVRESIQLALEPDGGPGDPEVGRDAGGPLRPHQYAAAVLVHEPGAGRGTGATDAIREAREALRVAFEACERGQAPHRDRALTRLPRPGEFSQLEWDIEPLLKKANDCSPRLQACRTITQQHSEG